MKVLLLFSFEVSLTEWVRSGLYDREMRLYTNLFHRYGVKFSVLTYGDETDLFIPSISGIDIVPCFANRRRPRLSWIRFLDSFLLPLRFSREFKSAGLYKSNQMMGAWVGVIAKLIYRKPFLLRCGYELSDTLRREGASFFRQIGAQIVSMICYQMADQIFVPTVEIKREISRKYFLKTTKINVHPNSVDTTIFSPAWSDLDQKKGVLFVGRLTHQKNISMLLDAIVDTDIQLTVVGTGDMEGRVKKQINDLAINATLFNEVANNDMVKFYRRSLIYVICSRYEGHPKSLIEAMSCGCAVVGTAVPGIQDIIKNSETGVLIPEEKATLRQTLLDLSQDKSRCIELGKAARGAAIQKFALSSAILREWQVYKILSQRA